MFRFNCLLILCLLLLTSSTWVVGQHTQYNIENFTPKEYGRQYEATNLAITQNQDGLIYTGNASGILEYDSQNWNYISINKPLWITSLSIDSASRDIYAGGQNEFGFFASNELGKLSYHSLSDSLLGEQKNFSSILKIHFLNNIVIFQAPEKIFIYQNKQISVINPETLFHLSFSINNQVFVRQKGIGLMKIEGNKLKLVSSNQIFKEEGIFAIIPFSKSTDSILIATHEKGLFTFNSKNKVQQYKTDFDNYLKESKVYGGIKLHDNSIALITLNGGMVIFKPNADLISIVNKTHGLCGNDIKDIYQDKHQNIWLALQNGISRIDYNNPLSIYGEESGISGSVQSILRFQKQLYVGTSNGLYVQKHNIDNTDIEQFYKVHDFTKQVWNLTNIDNSLIIGTNEGLYQLKNGIPKLIYQINARALYFTNGNLFVGGNKGLSIFKKKRNWELLNTVNGISEDIIAIAENVAKKDETELWIGTAIQGAIRLKITINQETTIDKFDDFDGLTEGWTIPFKRDNSIIFGTQLGLFRFVHEDEVIKSLPDSLKNDKDFARGFFEPDTMLKTNNASVNIFYENNGLSWFTTHSITTPLMLNYCNSQQPDSIIKTPFKSLDKGKINAIYSDNSELHWIGAADGLIRYVLDKDFNYAQKYSALIRNVTLTKNDSVVFFGSKAKNSKTALFPFSLNSMLFDYTACYYNHTNTYSSMLIGYDKNWSDWTIKTSKEYTNLHEGAYEFQIKAKNKFGAESTIASYVFIIQKPWYRTIAAYITYFIILALFIYVIILIGLHRLKVKNRNLEKIVFERTAEIRLQKEEINTQYELATQQRDLITHQKKEITDSIHYASRIQNAVIPSDDFISDLVNDYFILFKPKDIVSGDFYWAGRQLNKTIIIAADCTGHGVPGAFMSMLGTAFLNEIVNKEGIAAPDEILNILRKFVIKALKQEGEQTKSKDGMDMSVFVLDTKTNRLEFAGANNPLYLIRDNELIETKANKMPVAIYVKMDVFTKHEFQLEKGDVLYMFSDGYADQFGGPKDRKFMYKPFKRLLLEIQDKNMVEQKEILHSAFEDWRGQNEQIDDVLVVGIKI